MASTTSGLGIFIFAIATATVVVGGLPQLPGGSNIYCYDTISALSHIRQPVPCFEEKASPVRRSQSAMATAPTFTLASTAPSLPTSTAKIAPSGFRIDYFGECQSFGRSDFCEKTKAAFDSAINIMSGVFNLNTVVTVNATLRPYCPYSKCLGEESPYQLGGADPARNIPLLSDDGQVRMYPQALVKQFNLAGIAYTQYDIVTDINTNASSWGGNPWFEGDPIPTNGTKVYDVKSVLLHELLHGMGFASGWVGANGTWSPDLLPVGQNYSGFVESIFDQYMMLNDGSRRTDETNKLNQLLFPGNTTRARADVTEWKNSNPQVVAEMRKLGNISMTGLTVSFQGNGGNLKRYLETSINPYSAGSSASHWDSDTVNSTSDFLMAPWINPGGNLRQLVAQYNGLLTGKQLENATLLAGIDERLAIGPSTRALFAAMGWPMRKAGDDDSTVATTVPFVTLASTSTDGPLNVATGRRYRRQASLF